MSNILYTVTKVLWFTLYN